MRIAPRFAAAAVGMTMLVVAPIGSASADLDGPPKGFDHVRGTSQADLIKGSAGREFIEGAGGSDQVQGRGGLDFTLGGPGLDLVAGGLRSDWTDGGYGDDVNTGGDGADILFAIHGDDLLNGGTGRDWIAVGRGSDVVNSGDGGDYVVLLNDGRADSINCGAGRDLVEFAQRPDPLDTFRNCESTDGSEVNVPEPPILEHYESINDEPGERSPQQARAAFRRLLVSSS